MRAPRKSLAPETRARPKRASLFCSEIYRVSAERNGKRRAERGDVVRLPERLRLALPGDPVVVPEGPRRPGSRRRGGRRSGSCCATVPHPRPSHCPLLPATTQPKLERRRRHVPPPAHRRTGFCWGTVSWDDHGVRGVGPRRKQRVRCAGTQTSSRYSSTQCPGQVAWRPGVWEARLMEAEGRTAWGRGDWEGCRDSSVRRP